MERRKFIQSGCNLCLAVTGGSLLVSLLNACTPMPVYKVNSENKKVKIPLDLFAINDYLIVRPSNVTYDVAVIKSGDVYHSIIMKCTHADNQLRFNGKEFKCHLHGSIFSRSGDVETGPADKNLIHLTTEKHNDSLIISLI